MTTRLEEAIDKPYRLPNISCEIDYSFGRLRGCFNQIFGEWMYKCPSELLNGFISCLTCVTDKGNIHCENYREIEIEGVGAEILKEYLRERHEKILEILS